MISFEEISFLINEGDSVVVNGDALSVLKCFPSDSVQCVVTSPPYWGVRDYNVDGQVGHEATIDEYIANLVAIFMEVKRIMRADGVMWLNIGDVYTSGNRGYRCIDKKSSARKMLFRPGTPSGLKRKDLIGLPWRLALELQKMGWYLRCDIIWNKPNSLPESVKDRPCRSHEYVFMFSKNESYYYDNSFMRVKGLGGKMKNINSVWNVKTKKSGLSHYAAFPEDLIGGCILATSRDEEYVLDPFFGIGTVGLICEKNNRRYLGVEINSDYIDMSLNDRLLDCKVL